MRVFKRKSTGFIAFAGGMVCILFFVFWNQTSHQADLPAYYIANQAYQSGKFDEALNGFLRALKDNPGIIHKEPIIRYKIAHSFYQTHQYQKAIDVLENSRQFLPFIEDYLLYHQILSYLQLGDTLSSFIKIWNLRKNFNDSPLIPLLDSLQARFALHKNQPDSALKYLRIMQENSYFDRSWIYSNIIKISQNSEDIKYYSFLLLDKYPFHDDAESAYQKLLNMYDGKIAFKDLNRLFGYLFTSKQFLAAEELFDSQKKYATTAFEKNYFNWLPLRIAYKQGEYKRVLDWCLSKRNMYQSRYILREIDLNIARCYLRLGQIDQSIYNYLKFQKRYPNDGLSPEVLWKVAWLYESKSKLHEAIKTYQKLVKVYKRNDFYDEALFRIGLDYYRLRKFKNARKSWQKALQRTASRSQKDRISYWIGKCFQMEGNYKAQGNIYLQLAERPIDSYYNLKAFYLTSNGLNTHKRISEALWELHQQGQSYLPDYISQFRRVLIVEEILGSRWGDLELRSIQSDTDDWEELYALGELFERMRNFGYAYRKFRAVYNQYFAGSDLPEMVPLFKKLYPLYFTPEIDSAAKQYMLPPELILSVIKKESAFEPKIISYANAYGLMQLLPATASQIAPQLGLSFTSTQQLFIPEINIRMGTFYLSSLLKRYQGNYVMALAGYNAGPHRVDRWKVSYPTSDDDLFLENLEFEQTRVYVRTCVKFFWIYRAIMNPGDVPEEIVNYPVKITEFF